MSTWLEHLRSRSLQDFVAIWLEGDIDRCTASFASSRRPVISSKIYFAIAKRVTRIGRKEQSPLEWALETRRRCMLLGRLLCACACVKNIRLTSIRYLLRRVAVRAISQQPSRQLSTLRPSSRVTPLAQPTLLRSFHQSRLWLAEEGQKLSLIHI